MMFQFTCMYAKKVEALYSEKQISKKEYDACQRRIMSALYLRAYDHTQGKDGKIAELLLTPVHGNYNKDSVSPAGKVDCLMSDKNRSRKVEIKINGGCVQGLMHIITATETPWLYIPSPMVATPSPLQLIPCLA